MKSPVETKVKKTVWQPLAVGAVMGLLAATATVTGLTFITPGITDNAIGFYVTLFLLSAAVGGPMAGAIASTAMVVIATLFGPADMIAILSDPINFWSNVLALAAALVLVGFAYRLIFERLQMPVRLLAWSAVVIAYYLISIPSSVVPQYLLHSDPVSEILPAVLYGYQVYLPQAIFDIFLTCLVFVALPASFRRPRWYEPEGMSAQDGPTMEQNSLANTTSHAPVERKDVRWK